MTNYYRQLKIGNYPGDLVARRLVASGVWLRIAIVGASMTLGGLIALAGGQAQVLPALAFMTWGAIAAHVGFWRSRALLDEEVPASPGATAIGDAKVSRLPALR